MTNKLFNHLYREAKENPDIDFYIGHFGYPDYFDEISQDANEIVSVLRSIHRIAHMDIKDLILESKFTQRGFAERFLIPIGTVENWSRGRRECPEYTKIMIAKQLGLLPITSEEIKKRKLGRRYAYVDNYIQICKNFADDTREWGWLPDDKFFTTGGSGENGWSETSDNAHGGVDISWAYRCTAEEIEERAVEELLENLIMDIDGQLTNLEDKEDVRIIDSTLEQYRNI